MKKLVVLDGYAMNPGDLSWQDLKELVDTEIYDRTRPDQIVERVADVDMLITNKVAIDGELMRQLPRLAYIGVAATGYNIVDTKVAKELGKTVTNVPAYATASVAQFVFALLLELCHNVKLHSDAVRAGAWTKNKDWSFWLTPLTELSGKTMGIVGLGRIGEQVGQIAAALGMEVVYTSPNPKRGEFVACAFEELLSRADVVSLHCPLLPETEGLINARSLRLMKADAFLINTSRGPLIVEQDLAQALNDHRLGGAVVDVLSVEPPVADSPLFTAENCLITPHMAWATREARARLMKTVVENVDGFLLGVQTNVVTR